MDSYSYKPTSTLIKAGYLPTNKQLEELVEDWVNGRISRGIRGKHFQQILKLYKSVRKNPRAVKSLLEIIEKGEFRPMFSNKPSKTAVPKQVKGRPPQFWEGFDFACALLEDMGYTRTSSHPFNIADCLKSKVNRLLKNKIRKTKPYGRKK